MKKDKLDREIKEAEANSNYNRWSKLLKEYNDLVGKEGC